MVTGGESTKQKICLVCSAMLEAFGTAWTASAPFKLAKPSNVRCWPSEQSGYSHWLCASCMTIWIGGVLANLCGVWEGQNTVCAAELYGSDFVFLCDPFRHFLFSYIGLLARD